jgi:hypothetical protein
MPNAEKGDAMAHRTTNRFLADTRVRVMRLVEDYAPGRPKRGAAVHPESIRKAVT